MQVSTFIVLAKEQAEQEQLARNHHRQQYASMQQHLGMAQAGFSSGYALPQQAYLAQQQQHANIVLAGPPGMVQQQPSMVSPAAWPNAGAAGAYALGQPGIAVMQGGMVQQQQPQGSPVQHHPQQQQQQMWSPVANTIPGMLQQQQAGMQPVGQMMAAPYLDPSTAAGQQYPAGSYMMGSAQGMQGGLGSPAASTAMLLNVQPQLQQQQYLVQGAGPATSMPAQQQAAMVAAGYPATLSPHVAASVAAASSCPAAVPMAMAGPQDMGTAGACGIGGSTFVQDMLHSLDYVAAGGQGGAPAAQGQHQQQQAGLMVQQGMGWMPADGQQAAASWAMVQTPIGGPQAFPVAPTAILDNSPSFSATSSTSANTNTSFALPRMCAVSSGTCS